ncbi:MAG: class II aldolase/adducin family protein [Gammaproteobacteria bacterium WSBS_2016_MAG_OTU1]
MSTTSDAHKTEQELRIELAAAFRWTAKLDMHEGVANHFSVAVGDSGQFLMNPAGQHFSTICASDILLLDAASSPPDGNNAPDPSAWCLHGYLHRHVPQARCIMHLHTPYATALASLDGWKLQPIDQNSCRFYNRVSYDEHFGGMLLAEEEAARQSQALGENKILLMRGHGALTVADSIAEAFDLMYYFERTCRNQWLAMSTNRPLFIVTDDVAEKTACQWEDYPNQRRHFEELCKILQKESPSYRE